MKNGFTLIETIIYTALVGLILGTVVLMMNTLLAARSKNQAALILEEGMRFTLHRLVTRVEMSSNITSPLSGLDNTLTLTLPQPAQNPTTFTLTSGTVTISEAGSPPLALTGSQIEITSLIFTRLISNPASIRIQMTGQLRGAAGQNQTSLTLETTASLHR